MTNHHVKHKKHFTLNFATYNRSLSIEEKSHGDRNRESNIKCDVLSVSEVKPRGENLKRLESGNLFYQICRETETTGGVGFFIQNKHENNIS